MKTILKQNKVKYAGKDPQTSKKSSNGRTYELIDVFSGAGGLSLGFCGNSNILFKSVWANDINKSAVETYNSNFGRHCVLGNITDLLESGNITIPKADVVIGGPPCQGFSLLNKNRKDDPRNQLWQQFFHIVELSGANVFLMENVPQLLGSKEYYEIIEAAEKLRFLVCSTKLNSADYGVPQVRHRAFILGCRFGDPARFFPQEKTHIDPKKIHQISPDDKYVDNPKPWMTVRQAIDDLPHPIGTSIRNEPPPLDLHFGRNPTELSKMRYRAIPDEGMNRFDLQRNAPDLTPKCWIRKKTGGTDLFGRLWWDRPAFTIRTEFFKPEKGRCLHPSEHRPITHREAARFQSFPDWFIFKGTKIEIARQIGNAVPPGLASSLARSIYELLQSRVQIK